MLMTDPRKRAARAIVRRLLDDELLETENPPGTEEDLQAVLADYEQGIDDAVQAARDATDRIAGRLSAFEQEASKRSVAWGDKGVTVLRGRLVEALESSSNVAEIFADDATLGRIVGAALMDYAAVIESRRLSSLREGSLASQSAQKREPRPKVAVQARPTFADAGYPFALFEAPREDASIEEAGPCSICRTAVDMRFEGACYACFRKGRVTTSRDTELGSIDTESAPSGLTQGIPRDLELDARGTEVVLDEEPEKVAEPAVEGAPAAPLEEPWMRFRVAPDKLVELLRTPSYSTWQGESWLFCCASPMIFVGSVRPIQLEAWATEAGKSIEDVIAGLLAPETVDAEAFCKDMVRGSRSVYAFRCASCKKRRAHWDRD